MGFIARLFSYSYGKWGVEGEAMLAKTKYREDHPLYNKEREATELDLSTIVSYNAPFDIPDVAIYGFVGYSKVDENIGFFDSDTLTLGVGIGYEFFSWVMSYRRLIVLC